MFYTLSHPSSNLITLTFNPNAVPLVVGAMIIPILQVRKLSLHNLIKVAQLRDLEARLRGVVIIMLNDE